MSETEKAMARQAEILGLDWTKRASKEVREAAKGAKRLVFIGTGTSYHAALWAHWLCTSFSQGKIASRAATAWDELVARASGASSTSASADKTDEVVVVVSHRGNKGLTKDMLAAAKRCRRILIAAENSPVGKYPYIYTSPQETSQAHTMSLLGAMGALSEIIAIALPTAAANRLRTERAAASKLLANALKTFGASMQPILDDPLTKMHFVGGGPFHAVALELALKAREIAHLPAQGYNVEEILHGPLTSVDDDDAVVFVSGAKEPAKGILRTLVAKRLHACMEAAEAIGCMTIKPRASAALAKKAAELDACWQALVPLAWGQLFCVAQAKYWGFDPDSNRFEDPRYKEARQAAEYQA